MIIGIFTKMEMVGGSEMRAVELANTIAAREGFVCRLLAELEIPERIRVLAHPRVDLLAHAFQRADFEHFYSLHHLLVINSDSRHFTTEAYWQEKIDQNGRAFLLARVRAMTFLFNFIVSPACSLPSIRATVPDIRIITANSKFFNEISEQERYRGVRHFPRLRLESPIRSDVFAEKEPSAQIRFGMSSLGNKDKWNDEWPALAHKVGARFGPRAAWAFMGMPEALRRQFPAESATFRKEFSMPVRDFLRQIDVFVFFVSWKREEAWARSVGEAMVSGCPIITTPRGGNRDQVIHGNTGYLCRTVDEMAEACAELMAKPELLRAMRVNACAQARAFHSDHVVDRLLSFLS